MGFFGRAMITIGVVLNVVVAFGHLQRIEQAQINTIILIGIGLMTMHIADKKG